MAEQTKSKVEEKLKKEEKKRANFIKLARNRYKAAEKQIQLLMNLTAYAYIMDEDTAEEVLGLLESKVSELRKEWETRLSSLNKKKKKKAADPTPVVVKESTPVEPELEAEPEPVVEVEAEESQEEEESDSPSAVLAGLLNPDRDN